MLASAFPRALPPLYFHTNLAYPHLLRNLVADSGPYSGAEGDFIIAQIKVVARDMYQIKLPALNTESGRAYNYPLNEETWRQGAHEINMMEIIFPCFISLSSPVRAAVSRRNPDATPFVAVDVPNFFGT